ncbi:MAG: GNAT family N-acetyltransferase [Alphaproteobacteria bacterium]|jgi:GNAT superfamily N-acetyltransferase
MIETEHRLLPSGLKVRKAREYDVDAPVRLMGGQNAYRADMVPHIVKAASIQGTRAWCKAQLADPAMTIFLADARRRGIGKALIARVRAHAVTAACDGLNLNVWSANTEAIEAYEALNFETVYQRMTLSLDL